MLACTTHNFSNLIIVASTENVLQVISDTISKILKILIHVQLFEILAPDALN